ncbi:MAG: hypothetical protein WAU33_10635 [Candidatus Binataceae bacterium]
MFSRKPFVKLGTIITAVAAGLFFASGAFAAASVTAGLKPLSVQATGTAVTVSGGCTTPTISCPAGHACLCMTGTYSIIGNNGFNGGTASLTLGIDLTNLGDPITAVPSCAPATGVGTISDKKGRQTITFLTSGPVCSTNNTAADVFTGSYVINGGTGKYSSATGAGTIGAGASFLFVTPPSGNGVPSQASFNGSVQP